MTVPSHNLYDFVHQVTENQYWLMYFYPWGDKDMNNLIDYFDPQTARNYNNESNGLRPETILATKFFPKHQLSYQVVRNFQPVLLCYDQEPLNFDLYQSPNEYEKKHCLPNFNLRTSIPTSWQKQWILLHSEKNSSELARYESTGNYAGAYWWSHAVIALDWYRYAQHDQTLQHIDPKKLFLVYAREWSGTRKYRKDFLQMIKPFDNHCQIGSVNPDQAITSTSSAIYNSDDFNHTAISVVLETLFDDPRIHLTEKILRPIACGHPFILAAGPGSLKLLKHYGFETFDPWINESYDNIKNSNDRLLSIVEEMRRISQMSADQQRYVIDSCRAVAKRNQQRFFSGEFFDTIIAELKENVLQANEKTQGQLTPEFYLKILRWRHKYVPEWFTPERKNNLKVTLPLARQLRRST
jgi:hypothetical protein